MHEHWTVKFFFHQTTDNCIIFSLWYCRLALCYICICICLLLSFHVILISCNVCCTYIRQPLIALIRSKSFLARQWYVHSGSSLLWTIYWNDISLLSQGTGNSQKPEAFFGTQRKYMPMKLLPWFISWNTFIVLCMYCLIANSNQLSTIVSSIWEFQSVLKISNVHLHYFFQGHLLGVVRLMDGTKT